MEIQIPSDGKTRRNRLHSLSSVRKEMSRVYKELRLAGPKSDKISFFRACIFVLSSVAETLRSEKDELYEARLAQVERMLKEQEYAD